MSEPKPERRSDADTPEADGSDARAEAKKILDAARAPESESAAISGDGEGTDPLDALLARLADAPDQEVDQSPPRRLEAGARVARYQIVRELGRGGFGVVYEAKDVELGRLVALKALRPDRLAGGGAKGEKQRSLRLSLLQHEAETVARLQHPNIVTLYDLVVHDGLPYLVLELLSGETLQAVLRRGPLPAGEAIEIGVQIARGLAHAHAAGVIHRDLKPSNVFRTHDGLVKLLDLGLARGLAGSALLPRAGTPGFMAPEQWHGKEDERSDVYGAGLLLHAMIGGKVPHAFSGTGSVTRSDESDAKRAMQAPPLEVPASATPELSALILRATAAEASARPQSARALLDELLGFQRSTPASPLLFDGPLSSARASQPGFARPSQPGLAPAPQPDPAPPPRNHGRLALLALILGALVVIPVLVSRRLAQPHHPVPLHAGGPLPAAAAAPPDTFHETGALLWARAGATSTLLPDGLVLVAGGADESGASAAAELFDPQAQSGSGAFRTTAAMGNARQGATATLLGDGRVLIAGGESHGAKVGPLELFEVNGNRGRGAFWAGPILRTARSGHCAIALGDGRVLLAGGAGPDGAALSDAELFDPRALSPDRSRGVLLAPVAMRAARSHAACARLPDGRVLLAGGLDGSGVPLASAELFDPQANQGQGAFTDAGPLATPRASAAVLALDDGRVFLAGGMGGARGQPVRALASVERFDPRAAPHGGFVAAPPLLSPRSGGAAVALGQSALFAGGSGDNDNRLASSELYAPDDSPAAKPAVNLSTPRGAPAAVRLADGRVLIAGGDQRPGRPVTSAELFTPRGLGANALAMSTGNLHTARAFASVLTLGDGSVLLAGGRDGVTLDSLERFDPRTGAFNDAGRLRTPRASAAAVVLADGTLLLAGGTDAGGGPTANAERLTLLDTALRADALPPLSTARAFAGAALLTDGRALVVGGTGLDGAAGGAGLNGAPGGAALPLASAELFDLHAGGSRTPGFVATGSLATARTEPMIARLADGRVLVAGGLSQSGAQLASAELFDPQANGGRGAFVATGPMAQARSRAAIALLPTGKVLIAGGMGLSALASAELFDPLADGGRGAFQPTGGLAVARQRACIVLLESGEALVIGGADAEGGALASAELFQPHADDGIGSFTPAAGLSLGRELPLCARLPNGSVLVSGGRNNGALASAELWKPGE